METTDQEFDDDRDSPYGAAEYRDEFGDSPAPVNVAAVIAFIISLGGFLFVTDKFFFFIPAIAIVASIVAIAVFCFSPRPMVGKWLCGIALGLSLFFIVWRVSYERMRAAELKQDSIPIATQWLGYLKRGETIEAHVLSREFSKRASTDAELRFNYRDPRKQTGLDPDTLQKTIEYSDFTSHQNFVKQPIVKDILDHRDSIEFRHVRSAGHARHDNSNDLVSNIFEMSYDEDGQRMNREFFLVLNREDRGSYFNAHWHMFRIEYKTDEDQGYQLD